MEKAFHGRTMATLSATGSRKVQAGFEPLVSGFVRVPLNDLDTVRAIAEHNASVVAVLIEPIQGEGGINVSRLEYLRALRAALRRKGLAAHLDEVQCGIGRTGKWFAYQHAGIMPDVMTLAKGLAGGVPIGACVRGGRAPGAVQAGQSRLDLRRQSAGDGGADRDARDHRAATTCSATPSAWAA